MADQARDGVRGLLLMLHGGRSASTEPTMAAQLSVVRMTLLARPVRRALRGSGVVVSQPRFSVRGWNGELASPVADLNRWLDESASRLGPVPIALIGHSMGARAALRAAGHPQVLAVAALAPWLPPGEPAGQLAGTRVLLAHGDRDRVTDPARTWAYAEQAGAVTQVTTIRVSGGDHALLRGHDPARRRRGAPLWHDIAADFARAVFAPS